MNLTVTRLHAIAMYMETKVRELGFDVNYKVKNVYADFGLGTTHETIVVSDANGNNRFQIFSPRELSRIKNDDFNPTDADEIVEKHKKIFSKWNVQRLS